MPAFTDLEEVRRPGYDPFKDEYIHRRPPSASSPSAAARSIGRARPKLIDWRRAAKLLAQGQTPEAIAAALGIAEGRIWRHWRKSRRFRFYIQQAFERRSGLAAL